MKNIRFFYLNVFLVLVENFSIYLNRCVFVTNVTAHSSRSSGKITFPLRKHGYSNILEILLPNQRTDSPKSLLACKVLMECCVSSMQTQYMQRR